MGAANLNRMVRGELIEQVVFAQRLESQVSSEFGYSIAFRGRRTVWWRQVRDTGWAARGPRF